MKIKKVAEKQEIQDGEKKAARSEKEAKKLVPEQFYKWIKIFENKASERMLMRKIQDHAINLKEEFIPNKRKSYLLSREEREEVREFIQEQMRKRYI